MSRRSTKQRRAARRRRLELRIEARNKVAMLLLCGLIRLVPSNLFVGSGR